MKLLDPGFRFRLNQINHRLEGRLTGILTGLDDLDVLLDLVEELHQEVLGLEKENDKQMGKIGLLEKRQVNLDDSTRYKLSQLDEIFPGSFHKFLIGITTFEDAAMDLLDKLVEEKEKESRMTVEWAPE